MIGLNKNRKSFFMNAMHLFLAIQGKIIFCNFNILQTLMNTRIVIISIKASTERGGGLFTLGEGVLGNE